MKPYYSKQGIVIYHGDCRSILPTLPKVDLVLTDPPYGVGMKAFDDNFSIVPSLIDSCDGSLLACFMSPRRIVELAISLEVWTFERCVWMNKVADLGFPWRGWYMNSEAILLFSRPAARWPQSGVRFRSDTYLVHPYSRKVGHPNAKPLPVVADIIQHMTAKNQSILDPFVGSGTTLVAAKKLGRKAIGVEIEERYCEISARRVDSTPRDLLSTQRPAKPKAAVRLF